MQSDKREIDRAVCAVICRRDGLRAREIAKELGLDHETVNRVLYGSPLMKELCWQDRDYRWHGSSNRNGRTADWRNSPATTERLRNSAPSRRAPGWTG